MSEGNVSPVNSPAPGMLEALGVVTARKLNMEGDLSVESYMESILFELQENNPVVLVSGLSSLCYTLIKCLEASGEYGSAEDILFRMSQAIRNNEPFERN